MIEERRRNTRAEGREPYEQIELLPGSTSTKKTILGLGGEPFEGLGEPFGGKESCCSATTGVPGFPPKKYAPPTKGDARVLLILGLAFPALSPVYFLGNLVPPPTEEEGRAEPKYSSVGSV